MVATAVLKQLILTSALNVCAKVMGRNIQHMLRQQQQQQQQQLKQQQQQQQWQQQ
jgi:hypothetical protein